MSRYTPKAVKTAVEEDIDRLFTPWALGRPEGWLPDPATKMLVSLGYWLKKELSKVFNEIDLRTPLQRYNRKSRTFDMFQVASDVINEALEGKVEQNRKPHRRWG